MQKINLRELYPDIYKTDTFLEVADEVQAVFLADKRAEARYLRQMYNYKAHYSLDCDNGIEKAILIRREEKQLSSYAVRRNSAARLRPDIRYQRARQCCQRSR